MAPPPSDRLYPPMQIRSRPYPKKKKNVPPCHVGLAAAKKKILPPSKSCIGTPVGTCCIACLLSCDLPVHACC